MNVVFRKRDNSQELAQLPLTYKVERYKHAAIGGPVDATINVYGDDLDLWELLERARCPVKIYSSLGDCVWWGYAAEITVKARSLASIAGGRPDGRVEIGVSIDPMYNKVAVAYTQVDLTTGTSERATTDWADNTLSQTEFGIKELLWSADSATAVHAEAARDMRLEQSKYPIASWPAPIDDGTSSARIFCRGWWSTLEWRYYANAGTAAVDTATQAGTIIASKGQFFAGVDIDDLSGISIREERDGDASALFEAEKLLRMGTTNFRRLLASVDEFRRVRIYEEPAQPSNPYQIDAAGDVWDAYGEPLRRELCPVAIWARPKDVIPPSVDTSTLVNVATQFIESNEYIVAQDRLEPVSRGNLDAWDFPKMRDG
jgi:hypothetical protein